MFENIVFSKLANKNIFSNDFKIFNREEDVFRKFCEVCKKVEIRLKNIL